jgi:hypothetical protein
LIFRANTRQHNKKEKKKKSIVNVQKQPIKYKSDRGIDNSRALHLVSVSRPSNDNVPLLSAD